MNTKIIAGLLIIALAGGLGALFYIQKEQETAKISSLEQEIETVTAERIAVLKKVKEVEKEEKALNEQLQQYSDKLKVFQQDIASAKDVREDLLSKLSEKEKMIAEEREKIIAEEREKIIAEEREKIIAEEREKMIAEEREKIIAEEKEEPKSKKEPKKKKTSKKKKATKKKKSSKKKK